jgi:membrane-associated phospholipid phosphatase
MSDIATAEAPSRSRYRTPAQFLTQVALIVGIWLVYSLARSLSGDDVAAAVRHGQKIMLWDQFLGLGWTLELNQWVTRHALVAVPFTFEYASLHYVVTPAVLLWVWRSRPDCYRTALTALILMTAVGLVFYIGLPVAPPRLLPDAGWADTMRAYSHLGWWGAGASAPAGLEHLTDQYAAMPSLHVGWAIWCAWVARGARQPWVRRLAWLYPASIAFAVVVTANHYAIDVIAGALLAFTACLVATRFSGAGRFRRESPDESRAPHSWAR